MSLQPVARTAVVDAVFATAAVVTVAVAVDQPATAVIRKNTPLKQKINKKKERKKVRKVGFPTEKSVPARILMSPLHRLRRKKE